MRNQSKAVTIALIQDRMRERDLRTQDLARAVQLSEGFLRAVLAGRKRLPYRLDTLERIAEVLGIQPDQLDGYRQLTATLTPDVVRIRNRMKALGMTPDELHDQLAGTVQLPYLKALLTGGYKLPRRSPIRTRLEAVLDLDLTAGQPRESLTSGEADKLRSLELRYLACLVDAVILTHGTDRKPSGLLGTAVTDLIRTRLERLPASLLEAVYRLGLRVTEMSRITRADQRETLTWLLVDEQPEMHAIARSLAEHLGRDVAPESLAAS